MHGQSGPKGLNLTEMPLRAPAAGGSRRIDRLNHHTSAYGEAMRITHLGHASLLLEVADARILLDPGAWSPAAQDLRDLDAVLVTHQHPDHLDQERFPDLLRANPGAQVVADPDSAKLLQAKGIDVLAFGPGDSAAVKSATVLGVGEMHALIHDEIPLVHNTGMRVSADGEPTFFHPGDALDAEPEGVDVLAFPLNAPWARSRDMTAFLRRLAAPHAIPVHDGLLSAAGRNLYLTQADNLGSKDTQIHDLAGGTAEEFTSGG
jgi:L-ascorbate metabolism protein UlaG (beta-lactamase superfamily)